MKRSNPRIGIENYQSWAQYIVIAMPSIISVSLVFLFGVNVPYADEWGIVNLYHDILQNGLHFGYFFAQHNEHRIFFPRIVLLTTALLTKWNVVLHMLISQLMLIIVGICCCKYFWNKNGKTTITLWAAVPLTVLIFSLRQNENMFWGFQVGFVMAFAFSLFSFYFYDKYDKTEKRKYLFYSGIFAFVASYSSIQGLLSWLCLFVLFTVLRIFEKEKIKKEQILFLSVGILCWATYFIGYHKPEGHPKLGQGGLLNMINYFFTMIGGSIFPLHQPAKLFGVVLFILLAGTMVFVLKRKSLKDNLFPILLIFFALGVIASITMGRAGFGISQALSSRYTTYSLLIPTALYMIHYKISVNCTFRRNRCYKVGMAVLIAILFTLSFVNIIDVKHTSAQREYAAYALENFDNVPNEIRKNYFPIQTEPYMTELPQLLKDKRFSVFQNEEYDLEIPDLILEEEPVDGLLIGMEENNIQNINNQFLLIDNVWTVDGNAEDKASRVIIKMNESYYPAYYGLYRLETTLRYKNYKYLYSGFEASIPMDKLTEGANSIQVLVIGKKGDYYYASPVYTYINNVKIEAINGASHNFTDTDYAIDRVNGAALQKEIQLNKAETFSIAGWAVDRSANKALSDIQIKIGNQLYPVQRQSRPDVADCFKNSKYENSGFLFEISATEIPVGTWQWSIIGFSNDQGSYYEIPGGQITIKSGS